MKKQHILTLALAIFFFATSFHGVSAQATLSGDTVCGATSSSECTLADAKTVIGNFIKLVIEIGSILLVLFILYRFILAWFALRAGNANAYKEALRQATNALTGFFIVVAIVGGLFLGILKFLGVQDWATTLIKLISEAFVPHAYAQGAMLPNPFGTTSLYDFLLIIARTVIRWFIYPALIVMWVWTGFAFVAAQGAPEKLMKAKSWLMWAFVSTVIIFMTEGFLFALRGTVQSILPK